MNYNSTICDYVTLFFSDGVDDAINKRTYNIPNSAYLRLGLPKSDPKIVDWRDGSFWGKKSHEVAGCGIGILRMRNPLPCLVRSCQNLGGMGGGVRRRPAAAVVTPKIERRRLPS